MRQTSGPGNMLCPMAVRRFALQWAFLISRTSNCGHSRVADNVPGTDIRCQLRTWVLRTPPLPIALLRWGEGRGEGQPRLGRDLLWGHCEERNQGGENTASSFRPPHYYYIVSNGRRSARTAPHPKSEHKHQADCEPEPGECILQMVVAQADLQSTRTRHA